MNYVPVLSSHFQSTVEACSMGDRHSQLCYYESRGEGGGVGLMIFFARGVSLYGLFLTLSGIFDEKVGPFSEFLCLLEVQSYPKYDFEGCFGKKWLPFSN